eukprot:scaffold62686_cov37-Attheya_sp.AAC.1
MPLQAPLPKFNGVESLSGWSCYGPQCSLFSAAAGKYAFSCAGNLRNSLISGKRRDWELCTFLHTYIPMSRIHPTGSLPVARERAYVYRTVERGYCTGTGTVYQVAYGTGT